MWWEEHKRKYHLPVYQWCIETYAEYSRWSMKIRSINDEKMTAYGWIMVRIYTSNNKATHSRLHAFYRYSNCCSYFTILWNVQKRAYRYFFRKVFVNVRKECSDWRDWKAPLHSVATLDCNIAMPSRQSLFYLWLYGVVSVLSRHVTSTLSNCCHRRSTSRLETAYGLLAQAEKWHRMTEAEESKTEESVTTEQLSRATEIRLNRKTWTSKKAAQKWRNIIIYDITDLLYSSYRTKEKTCKNFSKYSIHFRFTGTN